MQERCNSNSMKNPYDNIIRLLFFKTMRQSIVIIIPDFLKLFIMEIHPRQGHTGVYLEERWRKMTKDAGNWHFQTELCFLMSFLGSQRLNNRKSYSPFSCQFISAAFSSTHPKILRKKLIVNFSWSSLKAFSKQKFAK